MRVLKNNVPFLVVFCLVLYGWIFTTISSFYAGGDYPIQYGFPSVFYYKYIMKSDNQLHSSEVDFSKLFYDISFLISLPISTKVIWDILVKKKGVKK